MALIARNEVVSFFAARAAEVGASIPESQLDLLPPHSLHRLLRGDAGVFEGTDEFLATGLPSAHCERYFRVLLCPDGLASDVQGRALPDHVPLRAPGIFDWVTLALNELRGLNQTAWHYIQDWIRVIVWVERIGKGDGVEVTSVSIPLLPSAVFVGKKIIRHIPPRHLLSSVSYYAIQENLYHEALHQQLTYHAIVKDLFTQSPQDMPHVQIPWRGVSWPVDRALHAAWVYQGLERFRRAMQGKSGQNELLRHADNAASAKRYLMHQLENRPKDFTPAGAELIEELRCTS